MYTETQPTVRTMATAFAAATLYTGLLFISATPAHAASSDRGFIRAVEAQLDNGGCAPNSATGVATVAVRVNADGSVRNAMIAGSTGNKDLDRDALGTAKSVIYPKGDRARTVAVVLTFGDVAKPAKSESARLVNRYVNAKGEALATEMPAPNAG